MGLGGYKDEVRSFCILIFFHYLGYIIFRVLEFLKYPQKVCITYDIRTLHLLQAPFLPVNILQKHNVQLNQIHQPTLVTCFITIADIHLNVPGSSSAPESQQSKGLDDKTVEFTKLVKIRYRKNSFFFYIGLLLAILGGTKTHCHIFSYLVIITETMQLAGVYFGFVWLAFLGALLMEIFNYINIVTAIDAFV